MSFKLKKKTNVVNQTEFLKLEISKNEELLTGTTGSEIIVKTMQSNKMANQELSNSTDLMKLQILFRQLTEILQDILFSLALNETDTHDNL